MTRYTLIAACIALGALAAAAPARANLVSDPGFENASVSPPWTVSGDVSIGSNTSSGSQSAAFGDGGTLSQSIATTPGTGYELSFAVFDENLAFDDTFTVDFGTFTASITGDNAASYPTETFSIPGSDVTGASTDLIFSAAISSENPVDWDLDDVSLTAAAVPEPPAALLLGFATLALLGVSAARHRNRCRGMR